MSELLLMFYLILKTLSSMIDIGFTPFPANEVHKVQLTINACINRFNDFYLYFPIHE